MYKSNCDILNHKVDSISKKADHYENINNSL